MTGLQTDLRFGLRLLRRNPETSVVAILAMAVAIGIAGTMFSVVNAIQATFESCRSISREPRLR